MFSRWFEMETKAREEIRRPDEISGGAFDLRLVPPFPRREHEIPSGNTQCPVQQNVLRTERLKPRIARNRSDHQRERDGNQQRRREFHFRNAKTAMSTPDRW